MLWLGRCFAWVLLGCTIGEVKLGRFTCTNIDIDSGPGGGGFMLVRNSDGEYEDIDFRETAPAAAFQDMYKDNVVS